MRSIRILRHVGVLLIMLVALPATINGQSNDDTIQPTPESTESIPLPAPEVISVEETYVVQSGDTLFRIAVRFGTTTAELATANGITNPRQIFPGQVLTIPGTQDSAINPEPTPSPSPTMTYIVQSGDTLFRIAVRFGTTVTELQTLNNLTNSNVIFTGQQLIVPDPNAPLVESTPTNAIDTALDTVNDQNGTVNIPTATPEPEQITTDTSAEVTQEIPSTEVTEQVDIEPTIVPVQVPDANFGYGIETFVFGQDSVELAQQVTELGMDWVKVRVEWRDVEAVQGEYVFDELETFVNDMNMNGINVLFTVTNAPDWAREQIEGEPLNENAPPADLNTFGTFMTTLAENFIGRVDAYQIWDEPNIRRNWSCQINAGSEATPVITTGMCETEYIDLLEIAFNAVKTADPNAGVITAGLAPTGFNDGVNAIADQVFLQGLYNTGVQAVSDAIAAHPLGWANPPDATCCDAVPGVETHFESPSFYFLETITAYRDIMTNNGDTRPLWITKFGWGTSQDTDFPTEANIFVTYTSLSEQAIYIPRAFEIGASLGYVGPMFLDNLNGCQGLTYRVEACYSSVVNPDGEQRPAYMSIQQSNGSVPMTDEPEATQEP